jgi:hypothetical protein
VLRLILHPWVELTKALYRFLRWLPLPAQDRWTGALHLMRLQVRVLAQVAAQQAGGKQSEGLVKEVLHLTARRWLEKQLLTVPASMPPTALVSDMCAVAVGILNLPTRIRLAQEKVTLTTYFCPFLEEAGGAGEEAAQVCQRVCGEHRSFFSGLSQGFPYHVTYRAPLMMGQGAEVCVKELHVRTARPLRKRRRSSRLRRRDSTPVEQPPPSILGLGP